MIAKGAEDNTHIKFLKKICLIGLTLLTEVELCDIIKLL